MVHWRLNIWCFASFIHLVMLPVVPLWSPWVFRCFVTWSAFLYGKKLDPISTPLIKDMPVKLTNVQHISQFLTTIDFNTSFLKLWYIIIHIRENQDVGSFFRRDFDFWVHFLCSCLYISITDFANENPRMVLKRSMIIFSRTAPSASSISTVNRPIKIHIIVCNNCIVQPLLYTFCYSLHSFTVVHRAYDCLHSLKQQKSVLAYMYKPTSVHGFDPVRSKWGFIILITQIH